MALREYRVKETAKASAGRRRAVFTAKIVKGESGYYVAYCEELPGCITQGRTIAEAQENFEEALGLYLETLADLVAKGPKHRRRPRETVVRVRRFALAPL